jgi:pimeloyl-ACP methyl ester carboxylesterase
MRSIQAIFKPIAKFVLLPLGVIVVVTVLGGLLIRTYLQNTIEKRREISSPNGIEALEKITIGGIDQWLEIRGREIGNPVILYLHGGPGAAMQPVGHAFQDTWESSFTVVHWDQRGAGRTHRSSHGNDTDTMSLERIIEDAREVVLYLRERLDQDRIFLLGHSWGSHLGIHLIKRYPELFHAYVGTGQTVNLREGLAISYQDTLLLARGQNNTAALTALENLGPPPYAPGELRVLGRWLFKLGGGVYGETSTWPILKPIILAPGYSLADVYYYMHGSRRAMSRILDTVMNEDLRDLGIDFKVPIFFFQGRHDHNTPSSLVEAYFNTIEAPLKKLIWFEQAGHVPMLEQPEEFARELIKQVLPVMGTGVIPDSMGPAYLPPVKEGREVK